MSDYTKTTNFTAKDALTTGDPNKVIKGSEHDTEYDAIATASATKANKVIAGTTDNVIKQSSGGDLVDSGYSFSGLVGDTAVTKTEVDILDGATVTTAELNILDGVTSTAAELNILDGVTATTAELNYVDGVTSAIQTQLNTGASNLTTHEADTTTHGTTGAIVGTSDTQTLSNKTLSSPTMTGSPIAPTQTAEDSSTKVATTAYVDTRNITLDTAVATTSGTSVTFSSIPSWAKRIVVMFSDVSFAGADLLSIQLGDSGGIETTGYDGGTINISSGSSANSTTSFILAQTGASGDVISGAAYLDLLDGTTDTWVLSGITYETTSVPAFYTHVGRKALTSNLTQIKVFGDVGGAFDAGLVNISYM